MKKRLVPLRRCELPSPLLCASAIGNLFKNQDCVTAYSDNQFIMLAVATSSFLLATLEATCIQNKQPALDRQKELIYALLVDH